MEIAQYNIHLINQLIPVLDELPDKGYSKPLEEYNQSTIGQHIRHTLEFYTTLMNGVDQSIICYDNRERQLIYEVNTQAAIDKLLNIKQWLGNVNIDQSLTLISSLAYDNESNDRITTTLKRELIFAFDHTVHHMAIVKIGLRINFPEIELDPTFGIAPSTIKHQKSHVHRNVYSK